MILLRTVHRDVSRYNAIDLSDDIQEDFGWKLVHAEVFRQPQHPMLLSIANGSGAQFAAMLGVSIFFALLGFLSPSNRGGLSTVMIVCWTLFGCKTVPYIIQSVDADVQQYYRCRGLCFHQAIRLSRWSSMEAKYPLDSNSIPHNPLCNSQSPQFLPYWRWIIWRRTFRNTSLYNRVMVLDICTTHRCWICVWNEERTTSTSCSS
jgi:hypothetical protein